MILCSVIPRVAYNSSAYLLHGFFSRQAGSVFSRHSLPSPRGPLKKFVSKRLLSTSIRGRKESEACDVMGQDWEATWNDIVSGGSSRWETRNASAK